MPAADALKTIAYRRVVDLTHPIHPNIPRWPGDPEIQFETVATIGEQGYYLRGLAMGEHSGAHLSSPAAFYPDGAGPDGLPPEALVAPAVVVDISRRAAANPNYALTAEDIARWERRHGTIPAASVVLLHTGWQRYWDAPARFINADAAGRMHTPGFGIAAARRLLDTRQVNGLGTDAPGIDPGIDPGADTDLSISKMTLAQPRIVLECLNNLNGLPPTGATLIIGRLPLVGGSGSPVAALALVP